MIKKGLLIAGAVIAMTVGGAGVASADIFCWPGSYLSPEYGQCVPDGGGWGGGYGRGGYGGDYGHHGGWGGVGGHGGHGGAGRH